MPASELIYTLLVAIGQGREQENAGNQSANITIGFYFRAAKR
jgi:hypothetical protein